MGLMAIRTGVSRMAAQANRLGMVADHTAHSTPTGYERISPLSPQFDPSGLPARKRAPL